LKILLVFLSFLPAIYVPVIAQQDTSLPVAAIDTVLVASEPHYPPYCIINEKGEPSGFSVDLFKATAKAARINYKIKIGIWSLIKTDLEEGRIDVLPLVGRTPEREEVFDFSMPYLSLHGAVFVRKGYEDINTFGDVYGKEIVVMKGDNAEEFLLREKITDKLTITYTYEEAFRQLSRGKHDAIITQRIMGLGLIEQLEIHNIMALEFEVPGFRQDFCFAVKKGNTELLERINEGLSVVIANNTFDELRLQWFGPEKRPPVTARDIFIISLYFIIPLIIILSFVFIVLLRREVARRTKKLQHEIAEHEKTLQELKQKQILLEESEAQIKLLLNSIAEGVFGLDMNGHCTFMNKSAMNVLGFKSNTEVVGKDIHSLIHHSFPSGLPMEHVDCRINHALISSIKIHNDEEYFWRTDGTSFDVEYFSHPVIKDGVISGAVVTFWDITERKIAEKKLKSLTVDLENTVADRTVELQEKIKKLDNSKLAMLYMVEDLNRVAAELKEERMKLEQSNRELEAFTYSVSHDLRAPLRAINGFSRFLLEDYASQIDEEGKRLINTICNNATKMDRLIIDLLNLSRVNKSEIKIQPVEMKNLITNVITEIATDDEKKQFAFDLGFLATVKCDPSLMKQVWQNLIGNALKYSSKSKVKKIEIYSTLEEDRVHFCIKDHGAGFNSKYKDKLFGIFQRLHKDTEFEGTGVGLAIVQRIVHRHGGKVYADGALDQGATFCFTLPS